MLLARPAHRQGPRGREELLARAAAFERGEWTSLLENARQLPVPTESPPKSDEMLAAERRERACAKVRIGEVSRARQVLTAAELAPGTEDTFHALTDPERRPPAARTPIPPKVLAHDPLDPVQLSAWAVATALREARRGGAPRLSGMRAEHLKLLLQDVESQELLAYAATRVARAQLPPTVAAGVAMARLTALRKPDRGVRGIATRDAFRRLVARTLAKQWAPTIDQATRPFQFAMQSRAGTDALVLSVRAALDTRENAVIVCLDGRSAYDSISRASFLAKLREVAPQLLPFARLFYGQASAYCWWDAAGNLREIRRGEGCELLWPQRFVRWDNTSPLPAPQRPCTRQTLSWLFVPRHSARPLSGISGRCNPFRGRGLWYCYLWAKLA